MVPITEPPAVALYSTVYVPGFTNVLSGFCPVAVAPSPKSQKCVVPPAGAVKFTVSGTQPCIGVAVCEKESFEKNRKKKSNQTDRIRFKIKMFLSGRENRKRMLPKTTLYCCNLLLNTFV